MEYQQNWSTKNPQTRLHGMQTDEQQQGVMVRKEIPDFILTDVTMPVMDGLSMIHEDGGYCLHTLEHGETHDDTHGDGVLLRPGLLLRVRRLSVECVARPGLWIM